MTRSQETSSKLPYIQKLQQRGPLSIWLVDGAYIRTHINIEFDNYGQRNDFDFIPQNELWLDREANPDEQRFFLERMLVERRALQRGRSQEKAEERALQAERTLRERAGDLKRLRPHQKLPDPKAVHKRLWKTLESGVKVWIVDGRLVRSVFNLDYTAGGHDYVYEFIPDGEVWIDNDLSEAERPYALVHELYERGLMEQGWTYNRAHEAANKLEKRCRRHPDRLHEELSKVGWEQQ
jgi:hypothetical protein